MNLSRRSALGAFTVLGTAFALSACSTGSSTSGSGSSAATSADTAYPLTVKHAFGSTTIEKQPQRVATVSWVNADVVLALGVVPVGMAEDAFGANANKSLPWKDAALEKLGAKIGTDKAPAQYSEADGINFEAIAKTNPDVIIGAYSGMSKEDYEKLSKIAPTIGYLEKAWGTSWEDSLDAIGKVLGKQQEAKKLKEETTAKLAKAASEHAAFKGKTFIFGNLTPGKTDGISAYTSNDNRGAFMSALGFELAPVVAKEEAKPANKDAFFVPFSAENASTLDSDIFLGWAKDAAAVAAIEKDPLLSQIPAVKKKAVYFSTSDEETISLSAMSVLSIDYVLEKWVPKIADAVAKA